MRASWLTVVSLSFIALLAIAPLASAQTLYGSLTGTVTDSTGAVVPNAKVEVLNIGTGIARQHTTDERGTYLLPDLLPGTYKVTISATSFATRIEEGVRIEANTVRRLDASLAVSQVSESITVAASAVTLQTDRADVNNQIRSSDMSNLPLLNNQGRNFQMLYKVLPGFSPPNNAHSDAGNPQRSMVTEANGMPQSSNNTRLDGATISYPWLPRLVAYVPPVEAVETVNVVTNSFDAEQGMAGGAAMNVIIKSGTNEIHGGGWEFLTNSVLKARDYFYCLYSCPGGDPNRAPKNVQNQFGAMMGAPIIRTSCSSSATGSAPRSARLPRRSVRFPLISYAEATSTAPERRCTIRPPETRTGPGARHSRTT